MSQQQDTHAHHLLSLSPEPSGLPADLKFRQCPQQEGKGAESGGGSWGSPRTSPATHWASSLQDLCPIKSHSAAYLPWAVLDWESPPTVPPPQTCLLSPAFQQEMNAGLWPGRGRELAQPLRGKREPGKELEQEKGRVKERVLEEQEVAKLLSRVTDGRAKGH